MATAQETIPYLTPEAYLAQERQAEIKSGYFAGEVYAMTGVSGAHNIIVANTLASLVVGLRGRPCMVYASDCKLPLVEVYDKARDWMTKPGKGVECCEGAPGAPPLSRASDSSYVSA